MHPKEDHEIKSHEIKRCLLLGRKVMTNLDSILKSRDITLPTKVHLVKAVVFPVVMRPSRRDQEGIRGSEQAVRRTLVFPSSETRVSGNFAG